MRHYPDSPWLRARVDSILHAGARALSQFWNEVAEAGTPLIEPIEGEAGEVLVTFLWRGQEPTRSVLVVGGWHGYHAGGNELSRLGETDVWFRSYRMPADVRATYHLLPDDAFGDDTWWSRMQAAVPDPYNSAQLRLPRDDRDPNDQDSLLSVFGLPAAPADPAHAASAPPGRCETLEWASERLGNSRRISIHTPAAGAEPSGLLLLFDGFFFHRGLGFDRVLDALVHERRIRPLVTLFCDHPDRAARDRELHASAEFAEFLTRELVPSIRRSRGLSADPQHTAIAGSSHGGLAAAFNALRHPDVFGNAIALSGAMEWAPAGESDDRWLVRQVAREPPLPVRWVVTVGDRETWLSASRRTDRLASNRQLYDVLRGKGYFVRYRERSHGHDYLAWRGDLAWALEQLFAPDGGAERRACSE